MKILIADKFEQVGVDALLELGCDVASNPDVTAETLADALRAEDPDVLIVRSTKVTEGALRAAGRLSLIIRAGAGVDTIDVQAASNLGIFVANCPGKNSVAVAELVFGLILSCDRRIHEQTALLREGKWDKKEYSKARGLYGRTLGIVGLGQIGMEIASRGRAFGMRVVGWSRSLTPEKAAETGVEYCQTPLEVARRSDVVTVNVAATSDTKELVNDEFIDAMQPGAYLINTSRGSVVNEAALTRGMREKGIRAGLDVYQNEPAAGDKTFANPIAKEPNLCGTHHIGASTDQAQTAIAHEAARIVEVYMCSGEVPNCVNRLARSSATHVVSVRHRNRPGVLAHVFGVLASAGINVEEVENIIYHGAEATCARIHVDGRPGPETLSAVRKGNENIISVEIGEVRSA